MELRHFRYFVAAAEERSFIRAAKRLRVAQPALSKQIRDLEGELGTPLFQRLPRGVQLTSAGEAFLIEARRTLDGAERAVLSARDAARDRASVLSFAHGELSAYTVIIEDLLAAYRTNYPDLHVHVSSVSDSETFQALRDRQVDVGCVFLAAWPVNGFNAHRLVDCRAGGVLLPAGHPLAAKPTVHLAELQHLTWLHSAPERWPGFFDVIETALRDRGLVPERRHARSRATPAANVEIAAGNTWALASETIAAPYRGSSAAIVYRPFAEPAIPCWISLIWSVPTSTKIERLLATAARIGLAVGD
jgi:LysR family transcriptional regulator, hca operon transcriptional activator